MSPDAIEDCLDIPRYSIESPVEMAERFGREGASVATEEPFGKFLVLSGVDGVERHELCALVESIGDRP